ncbi:hypothetical protein Esti_000422 [Eimeria stiedai]
MQHEHEGRSELRRRSGAPGGPLGGPSSAKGHPCAQGELERIKQSLMEDEEEEIGEGSVISEEGDCCPRLDAFERQFLATPPPLQEEGMPKYALLLAVSLTLGFFTSAFFLAFGSNSQDSATTCCASPHRGIERQNGREGSRETEKREKELEPLAEACMLACEDAKAPACI